MSVNKRLLEATIDDCFGDAKRFLEKGADPHAKVRGEDTHAFGEAAKRGLIELMELMIDHGANLDCPTCDRDWGAPLHLALQRGHEDVVKLLLERGASVEARNRLTNQPILHAACRGMAELVEELLDRGALVDSRDDDGDTPLHYAKDVATAQLLVARGADVHALNAEGLAPTNYAVRRNNGDELIDYLVSLGADLAHQSTDGETLLHDACRWSGSLESIQRLLDHGVAANAATSGGWTALHCCAVGGFADAVPLLVSAGAQVDAQASKGELGGLTPLLISARYGEVPVAAKLLEVGADACAQDDKGATPLSYLLDGEAYKIDLGDLLFAQLLIAHGAVATNKQQRTLARLEKKLQRQREKVARFDWGKLEAFLVKFFRAGIADFAAEVDDELVCGFGLDCNVQERGQMMLSLNTVDYLEAQLTGRLSTDEEERRRFGPGNWAYGELAVTTDDGRWHRIIKPLTVGDYVVPEIGELLMQSACRAALRLIEEGALTQLTCADDVAVIVIDHNESVTRARERMANVRAAK